MIQEFSPRTWEGAEGVRDLTESQMKIPATLVLFLAAVLVCQGPSVAQDGGENRDWARNLRLTVFGGPSAGTITLTLNGEFVAEFDGDPPIMTEIADLLRAGENELGIEIKDVKPDAPARDLRLSVAPVQEVSTRQLEAGRPVVHVTIPGRVQSETCQETLKFWVGPAVPGGDLESKYWLVVTGAPSPHLVSVRINGKSLLSALEGDAFYDITEHVTKGKNNVEYESRASCLSRPTDRRGDLEVFVSSGEERSDIVEMTGPPSAMFRVPQETKKESLSRTSAFRGR